ncbi:hypothetical protein [Phormidium sp. CCY1219]|uniref:hypothetical protein n=1 Tax=Phormidium sp. CCY1219 TaxID=2886104 RepID=UPI002D1F39F5|nr:hypothetical protein [Phormidium sp. CCY1219]MEB3829516.1 hypothetical protein [Phormidium sp. CCY1219]
MKVGLKRLIGAVVVLAAAVGTAPEAIAQDRPLTINEQFEEAFFDRSGTFYQNRSLFSQIGYYLLPFTYPEGQIAGDAKKLNRVYEAVLEVQTSSDPIIRTPDLDNPFDESLLTSPLYLPEGQILIP